ncbi:MAG: STAS domain-containing protein [Verrucomicrobiota bacterium]|nr:STAS domain-containing protein [Verrucomicrobiota bacterium]
MSITPLQVALHSGEAKIKIEGMGTLKISEDLKKFCLTAISKKIKKLVIDLSSCSHMDSTFMGTLTEIELYSRKIEKTFVTILNISPENKALLSGLGLKNFFNFVYSESETKGWKQLDISPFEAGMTNSQSIIDAHKALMDVDEKNIAKFEDVITFLEDEPRSD